MATEFLIAHKVRGELAFDVAIQMDGTHSDPGPWWIVSTSGHRAYPFWWRDLNDLFVRTPTYAPGEHESMSVYEAVPDLPESLRDHYAVVKPPAPKRKLDLNDLDLGELGL